MIGNMRGERRILKLSSGRWHFDVFLAFMFVYQVRILVGVLLRMPGAGSTSMWIVLWLFMYDGA